MGEDWKYLHHYVENYKYIALGGMVGAEAEVKKAWLDECFKIICDKDGHPKKVKVHGFGIGDVESLWRYRNHFYSVDTTSWMQAGKHGSVYVPRENDGKYDYKVSPWTIDISVNIPAVGKDGKEK